MKSEKHIKKLFKKLHFTTDKERDEKTLNIMMKLFNPSDNQNPSKTHKNQMVVLLKGRLTKFALIPMIIIVILLGMNHFFGPFHLESASLADVIRPFLSTPAATFKISINSISFNGMLIEPGYIRLVNSSGEVIIGDLQKGDLMILLPHRKKATVLETGAPEALLIQQRPNVVERVRELIYNLQENRDESVEFLGQREIDDVTALAYQIVKHGLTVTIWVNEQTSLPVKIKCSKEIMNQPITFIVSDFVYHVELEKSLFSMIPPEGYSVTKLSFAHIEPGLVVTGTVLDASTKLPIPGAMVSDDGYGKKPYKGSKTGPDGRYRYITWAEEHNILASAPGYKDQRKTLITSFFENQKKKY